MKHLVCAELPADSKFLILNPHFLGTEGTRARSHCAYALIPWNLPLCTGLMSSLHGLTRMLALAQQSGRVFVLPRRFQQFELSFLGVQLVDEGCPGLPTHMDASIAVLGAGGNATIEGAAWTQHA